MNMRWKFSKLFGRKREFISLECLTNKNDFQSARKDDLGVIYDKKGKRLLLCTNKRIQQYVIKKSTKIICEHAFDGCRELMELTLPKSISIIGDSAFKDCAKLSEIIVPNNVTLICRSAFCGCTGLTAVTLGYNVTSIERGVFENCVNLSNISLPKGIKHIGEGAFKNCSKLKTIKLPISLEKIETETFEGCRNLNRIDIPKNVWEIVGGAFEGCDNLTEFNVDANNRNYCSDRGILYSKDRTTLYMVPCSYAFKGLFTIPSEVTTIGIQGSESIHILFDYGGQWFCRDERAFLGCKELEEIIIPNTVVDILPNAFKDCPNLRKVTIGEGLTEVGHSVFEGCAQLEILTIGSRVSKIKGYAIKDCVKLRIIICYSIIPPICENSYGSQCCFEGVPVDSCMLYVPKGSKNHYLHAQGWNEFEHIEEIE